MTPAIAAWIAREPSHRRLIGTSPDALLAWHRGEPQVMVVAVRVDALAECADADAVQSAMRAARMAQLQEENAVAYRDLIAAQERRHQLRLDAAWLARQ
jgi:hypothetical protein